MSAPSVSHVAATVHCVPAASPAGTVRVALHDPSALTATLCSAGHGWPFARPWTRTDRPPQRVPETVWTVPAGPPAGDTSIPSSGIGITVRAPVQPGVATNV